MDVPPSDQEGQNPPEEEKPGGESPGAPPVGGPPPPMGPPDGPAGPPQMGAPQEGIPPGYAQATSGYAGYPRYSPVGAGAIPPGPPAIRFEAIGEAWNLLRQDFGTYVMAMLIVLLVGLVQGGAIVYAIYRMYGFPFTPDVARSAEFQLRIALIGLPFQLLTFPLNAGFFWMCVRRLRGEGVELKSLWEGYQSFLSQAVIGVVVYVLGQIGNHLLYVPTIFFLGALAFAPIIVIDQKTGPFEAMRSSVMCLGIHRPGALVGNIFLLGLLIVATFLIIFVPGVCTCGVGIVCLMPLYYLVVAIHYHAFFPPQNSALAPVQFDVAPQYST